VVRLDEFTPLETILFFPVELWINPHRSNMLNDILEFETVAVDWDWRVKTAIVVLFTLLLTQLITSLRCSFALRQKGDGKIPAIASYAVLGAGNLFSFAFNTHKFITNIT
jgi:hypothetical protein